MGECALANYGQINYSATHFIDATGSAYVCARSLLRRGSMFILSEEQFKRLLLFGGFDVHRLSALTNGINILDIGAGDGEVTMRLARGIVQMKSDIYLKVFATEFSWTMRDRLQEKQFTYVPFMPILLANVQFGRFEALNVRMFSLPFVVQCNQSPGGGGKYGFDLLPERA